MKKLIFSCLSLCFFFAASAQEFNITRVEVAKNEELRQMLFSIEVEGLAGDSVPQVIGKLDGAPVLGYVFPTSLKSQDVGFDTTAGIVALALTSHPDFDDTPLWDENGDLNFLNDGVIWHPHWVLLESNGNVPGGLAVKPTTTTSKLPATNPGMPMYMDSPGFDVIIKGNRITCVIPLARMNNQDEFKYDGVAALMKVNTSQQGVPMLGVYQVFSVASGDLSLPFSVGEHSCDTLFLSVSTGSGRGLIEPKSIRIFPNPSRSDIHLEVPGSLVGGGYVVQVVSSLGQVVHLQNLDALKVTIPGTSLDSNGVFVLNVIEKNSGEVRGSKRLVIQK